MKTANTVVIVKLKMKNYKELSFKSDIPKHSRARLICSRIRFWLVVIYIPQKSSNMLFFQQSNHLDIFCTNFIHGWIPFAATVLHIRYSASQKAPRFSPELIRVRLGKKYSGTAFQFSVYHLLLIGCRFLAHLQDP